MFGQKSTCTVCYVDRNKFQFYAARSSIVTFDVPTTIIKNLEIINRDSLYVLVSQWLKQHTLDSDQLLFILASSTYFDISIAGSDENIQETEILKFYDLVPFDELITKVVPVKEGKHVFAVNKSYLESIQHAFYLQGIHVIGIIPKYVLGSLAARPVFDTETGGYAIKHLDALLPYSMIDTQETNSSHNSSGFESPQAKTNTRTMMMVGVFGILLLVLIILLFTQR